MIRMKQRNRGISMVPFSLGNADAKYIGRKECSLSLQLAGSSDTVYDNGAVR